MLRSIKMTKIRKSTVLSVLLLYSLILLLFSSTIFPSDVYAWVSDDDDGGGDDDENGIDDDIEDYNERELQIEVDADQVEIQSKRKNETLEDKIEISFKASDEPEFHLQYRTESDSLDSEISFEVSFYSLVEFLDTDENNQFDEDFDQEVQEYELDREFTTITEKITDDGFGNEIHTFNTTTEDGIFSLQFYVLTSFSQLSGSFIVPSEIKLDLAIRNFPFIESISKLALHTNLEAENEFEIDEETEDEEQNHSSDEKAVDISIGHFTSFFSWYEYALVDGINQTVYNGNIESDESENEMIFLIYEQGNQIIHDPKIGFENITKFELPSYTRICPSSSPTYNNDGT